MTHPSRIPADVSFRQAEVVRLTKAGATIPQICQQTGLSRTSVVRIRRERGVTRPKRPALTAAETARAEALLDDGASIAEVVRTLGCGRSQIDYRFPGRAWSIEQCIDHLRVLRTIGGNHSADQIVAMWAAKKRRGGLAASVHTSGTDDATGSER